MTSRPATSGFFTAQARAHPVERAMRAEDALRLRAQGVSVEDIATRLGLRDAQEASSLVRSALSRRRELNEQAVQDVRTLELERLDKLMEAVWEAATGGDLSAIDTVLTLMDRRSKLLGMDRQPASSIHQHLHLEATTPRELPDLSRLPREQFEALLALADQPAPAPTMLTVDPPPQPDPPPQFDDE